MTTRTTTQRPLPIALAAITMLAVALAPSAAFARVAFEPASALASGPETAGLAFRLDGGELLVAVVEAGTGTVPDVVTGFVGDVPADVLGRGDTTAVLRQSDALISLAAGVVVRHDAASFGAVVSAYQEALADLGFALVDEALAGGGRALDFAGNDMELRAVFTPMGEGVQVYLGP
jgi:hypothetical protein